MKPFRYIYMLADPDAPNRARFVGHTADPDALVAAFLDQRYPPGWRPGTIRHAWLHSLYRRWKSPVVKIVERLAEDTAPDLPIHTIVRRWSIKLRPDLNDFGGRPASAKRLQRVPRRGLPPEEYCDDLL